MNYDQKKVIANNYLQNKADVSWDDLPDINSLHNAETEEDIISLCNDRLKEQAFPFDMDEDES